MKHQYTTFVTSPVLTKHRRFRTQFYITFLAELRKTLSSEQITNNIPTPDGGKEVVLTRFVRPSFAITEFRKGNIILHPPQYYLLETLCQLLPGNVNTPEQREKALLLSQGPFGRLVIQPKLHHDLVSKAEMFLYEGDELRGGPPGQLHRAIVKRNGTVRTYKLVDAVYSEKPSFFRKSIYNGTLTFSKTTSLTVLIFPSLECDTLISISIYSEKAYHATTFDTLEMK